MKELNLEQIDSIYPMIDRESRSATETFLSFRTACAQAKRLFPQHGGGGLLICALVLSNGFETWGQCRKEMDIKKIRKQHLVPVMEANPDFLPLPAPAEKSPVPNGENQSPGQSRS